MNSATEPQPPATGKTQTQPRTHDAGTTDGNILKKKERKRSMDEKDNIELRSEKVRNIIGGVPPRLVRAGTVVIITICVALALAAWLIKIDGTPVWRMIFFSRM